MKIEVVEFGGWKNNLRLSNDQVELVITLDVGPRIIRYGYIGDDNAFREFPDQYGSSNEQKWVMRGGHRFWIAPETMGISSEPDNEALEWQKLDDNTVRIIQKPGLKSGIQKTMNISLYDNNQVEINHILKNLKDEKVTCSAWPITVMPTEGTTIIPLPPKRKFGEEGTLDPDRVWVFWPYTDINDYRISWGKKVVRVKQDPNADCRIKLGASHRAGWVAYLRRGNLFIKTIDYKNSETYPDENCNFEMFVGLGATEVESLGPLKTLKTGEELCHKEKWQLYRNIQAEDENEIEEVIFSKGGLML